MRVIGRALDLKCAITDTALPEIAPRFVFVTADVVTLPPSGLTTRVVGLMEEIDDTGPAEWLYTVGGAGNVMEDCWAAIATGTAPTGPLPEAPPNDAPSRIAAIER
jgi:hypothetical protein